MDKSNPLHTVAFPLPTLPVLSPSEDVRHRQKADIEDIYREAAEAVRRADVSLAEVGRRIGVTRQAVHKAMQRPDTAMFAVYDAILRALTSYGVEREETVTYRFVRAGDRPAEA